MLIKLSGFKLRKSTWIFLLIATFYVIVFTMLSFARLQTHKTYMNDLGNMDQAVWGSLHGHFLHQSNTIQAQHLVRFYAHFDPVLLLFVPFYKMIPTPLWFLIFQTLAIALGAVPVFLLARNRIGSLAAIVLSAAYFLYPLLQNANLYDFHPCVLAVPVISFMIWAVLEEKPWVFWPLAVLLCTMKEEMSLLLICLGALLFVRRKYKQGIAAMILGGAVFLLVMKVIIPAFSPFNEHVFFASQSTAYGPGFSSRFAWLGTSIGGVLHTMFTRPLYVLSYLATPDRIEYLFSIFSSLLFLPLFSSISLVLLPTLLINLFDTTNMMHSFYFYHSAVLAPVLFLASVDVLARIRQKKSSFISPILLGLIFMVCLFNMREGVLPYTAGAFRYSIQDFLPKPHYKLIEDVKKHVPESASISVQQNLGIFFSQRLGCYRFPMKVPDADFVLVDFANPYNNEAADRLFDYLLLYDRHKILTELYLLVDTGIYGVIYDRDGYILLKKGHNNISSHKMIELSAGKKGFI